MNKILMCLATVLVIVLSFTGCDEQVSPSSSSDLKIVATTFPQYDWVREILGEHSQNTDLTLLLDNGADLHSYQPTVQDISIISDCDMFIYVGGTSDAWVEDALQSASNKDMIVINLLDVLDDTVKEEEIKDGMEHMEGDHDDRARGHEDLLHDQKYAVDEHVWLSLENAQLFCSHIASELCNLNPQNAEDYKSNAKEYNSQLAKLESEYESTVDNASFKTILFGDRFPFRYLTDDVNLDYFAAFPGCSSETEASFDTIKFLADKTDELGLKSVLVTESSDKLIARTIIQNTSQKNQKIIVLDSMQSIKKSDIFSGQTYLSIMKDNLQALKGALN
ncbi:MAG: metal ABC transporter substrate-binding protein [Eubacteriales bacterium]|nr:metal ABC transporter substrate-binding protein [Eubacteriales bacterium]MDD4389399.1 metal ABC transporter substrate-binding protein [Eubacteriales bacterium]